MKLLIVTQKIDRNDELLGSFHRWVQEFAKHAERVSVIAGFVGEYNFPKKVEVFSLGKEAGRGKIGRVWRFWELFSKQYASSDAVFFHMCPEFVLAAFPFLASLKRTTGLWYVHRLATRKLKMAERMTDFIFSASESTFLLPSKKAVITGHAIDTEFFKPAEGSRLPSGGLQLLTVGRISPVKNLETIIHAAAILKSKLEIPWILSIVGAPFMPRDHEYFTKMRSLAKEYGLEGRVVFQGARPYGEMPSLYREHDLLISLTPTGSFDKAALEAMSCGLTIVTASAGFKDFIPARYVLEHSSPEFLAERVLALAKENRPNVVLREAVLKYHSLEKTVKKIVESLALFNVPYPNLPLS